MTKEEYIAEHRKMWNWIATEIEKSERTLDIGELKEEYCKIFNFDILLNCFLCDYAENKVKHLEIRCNHCPLQDMEKKMNLFCLNGLYSKVTKPNRYYVSQYSLAFKIANLEEVEK